MIIYNSFLKSIGEQGSVDLFVYHYEEELFLSYITANLNKYDYYVIMPHFKSVKNEYKVSTPKVTKTLQQIPSNKLIILDNNIEELKGDFGSVYQDFKNDLYMALIEAQDKIVNYKKFSIVYPKNTAYPYPKDIQKGFVKFCSSIGIDFEIYEVQDSEIILEKGNAYLIIDENSLINALKYSKEHKLKPGRDVGLISYNDTPLKELLEICVVSTSFAAIGETAAFMIKKNKFDQINNVFKFIQRKSL